MQIQQLKDLGIITGQLTASRDFYVSHLGFEPVFVSDWYIHLKNGPVELGLMAGKPEMPAANASGVWVSLGVANVDAEYSRLERRLTQSPRTSPGASAASWCAIPMGWASICPKA